jgi:hypothetical protein
MADRQARRLTTIDGWGAGRSGQQKCFAGDGSLGNRAHCHARRTVAQYEIGQQRAGTRRADEFQLDQEVVGRVAEVGLEATELAAGPDLHLAVTSAGLGRGPQRIRQTRHRHLAVRRERMGGGQDEANLLSQERCAP